MELNDFKEIWKQQEISRPVNNPKSEILSLVDRKMTSLEYDIQSRDRREIIVCFLSILFLGYFFFTADSNWTRLGCLTLISAALFVTYRLKANQLKTRKDESYNRSMESHLRFELKQVKKQKNLLENIGLWYIGPIFIGLTFLTIGFETGLTFQFTYMIVVIILMTWVWRLNQKAVKNRYDPLIHDINEAIESISEED